MASEFLEAAVPFISVIIPVYNDGERLRACLEALGAQNYPVDRWEVIVVDNGSAVPPKAVVDAFPFCRFDTESQPGSYAARNRGLEVAKGGVLAFTDSDCVPAPNWLAAAEQALRDNPECGFVGGRVEIFPRDVRRPTAVELYDMVFGLRQCLNVSRFHHAATANMITRREMFDRCGNFDAAVKSGGDMEWGQRVTSRGFPGVYAEAAVVRHPARSDWAAIVRQTRRHAGGRFDRHRAHEPYKYFSWRFWRAVYRRFVPNVGRMCEVRRQVLQLGYGTRAWMRTCVVLVALQYAAAFEFVRMWFGSSSERR